MTSMQRSLSGSRFRSHFRLLPVALCAALAVGSLSAQTRVNPATTATVQFSIAPQPLAQALNELARQARLELIVSPTLVAGKSGPAVSGLLTPQQALAKLLEGSGLVASMDGAAIVVKKDSADARTLAPIQIIDSATRERATGPVLGYVAKRSATGTKTDTELAKTPQSITVVTREQIADQDAQSVAQSLRYSSGVVTEYRGASNLHDEMFVRGFYYVPRYLNGLQYGNGSLGQIDPYLLERVELLRGPSSMLYGQSNPGGIINMVTKQPTEEAQQELQLGVGNNGRRSLGVDVGGRLSDKGDLQYRLVFSGEQAKLQEDNLRQERYAFAPSIKWNPSAATDLTLQAIVQREPQAGFRNFMDAAGTVTPTRYGYIPRTFLVSDPNYDKSTRDQTGLAYSLRHAFSDTLTLRQNLRVNTIESDYRTLIWNALQKDDETITRMASGGIDNIKQLLLDNQLQSDFQTGAAAHKLLLGLDVQQSERDYRWGMNWATTPSINWRRPVYNVTDVALNPTSNTLTTATQTGVYVQDQIEMGALALTLGARQDWARTDIQDKLNASTAKYDDSQASGRIGAVYSLGNGWSPYASVSTSFEPVLEATPVGEARFKPTTGQQVELGVKYTPPGSNLHFSAAAYDLKQQNVLFYDYATSRYQQTGAIKNQGVELELKAEVARNFNLIAAYSSIDSRVTESVQLDTVNKVPSRIPRDQASLWGKYDFTSGALSGFGIGAGVRYTGTSQGNAQNTFTVPATTLFDLSLAYDAARLNNSLRGVKLQLNVNNLTDETFVASCASAYACFYGGGRSVNASLKYGW